MAYDGTRENRAVVAGEEVAVDAATGIEVCLSMSLSNLYLWSKCKRRVCFETHINTYDGLRSCSSTLTGLPRALSLPLESVYLWVDSQCGTCNL